MSAEQILFTFKGEIVTDIVPDILIPDVRRPLRPEVQRRKVVIPGRDGSWDFGPGAKRDFEIEVDFILRGTDTSDLMSKFRLLSAYLDGKGELFFSDDEDEKYQAQVLSLIVPERRVFSYVRSGMIVFECDA